MKLILGLGNPGEEYESTRHNAGREAVSAFAASLDAAWKTDAKRSADIAKTSVDGQDVICTRTKVYMNESGTALTALASYYKVPLEDVLVVQDDMDLAPGRLAFIRKGGAAGHKGITDIQRATGRDDVCRLRIGIGRPTTIKPIEDWVLERPTSEDADAIGDAVQKSGEAIKDWIELGPDKAMTKWNVRKE